MFTATLSHEAQAALALLGKSGLVKDAYLAGGSALALHYGHRISIDLDFFSTTPFIPSDFGKKLKGIGVFHTSFAKGITLDYPLIEKTTLLFEVPIAHPHDIAAMKLVAITDRSTKKDFVDLYELIGQGISLDRMLELYQKKYHMLDENIYTLLRALRYFDEIEHSAMPEMLSPLSWDEVKQFFIAESMRLARGLL